MTYALIRTRPVLVAALCFGVFATTRADPPTVNQAKVDAPTAYVDQYFDDSVLTVGSEQDFDEEGAGDPTFINVAYRYYRDAQDGAQTLNEHGAEFRWRRESLNYGDLEFQADRVFAQGRSAGERRGERFSLSQRGFVLNENVLLDNTLGHFRGATPTLISNSYRFSLPSTLLLGFNSIAYNDDTSVSLTAGSIGTLRGVTARAFDETSGDLLGIGAVHRVNPRWTASGQYWRTNGTEDVLNHSAFAGAVEYADESKDWFHQLRGLQDSRGHFGVWYDGLIDTGQWINRFGGFHFEPGLMWTDTPIQSDLQGLYWRGGYQSFRWRWTLGSEATRNNLAGDPARSGNISTRTFANGTWRYRRNTQFGGFVSLSTLHPDSGLATEHGYVASARGFLSQQFRVGLTRIETRATHRDLPDNRSREYEMRWDQDWAIPFLDRLTTGTSYLHGTEGVRESLMGVIGEKIVGSSLRLSGQAQMESRTDEMGTESSSTNLGLGLTWEPRQDLLLGLSATMNKNSTETTGGMALDRTDSTVLLSLNYRRSSGGRASIQGVSEGRRGIGRAFGRVFLDQNRDGRLSVGEDAVADLTIYLDGGYSTRTDPEGRFEFSTVATGEHRVSIALEDVPLPWGLEDETAVRISVSARGETRVDFGLIRLDE